MSAKSAKTLRRLAKKLAGDALITKEVSYSEDRSKRARRFNVDKDGNFILDEKGNPTSHEISIGMVTVDAHTVKGVYKTLKKAAKSEAKKN